MNSTDRVGPDGLLEYETVRPVDVAVAVAGFLLGAAAAAAALAVAVRKIR